MNVAWDTVRELVETGGPLLWVIFAVIALIWTLTFERVFFFLFGLRTEVRWRIDVHRRLELEVSANADGWHQQAVRSQLVSEVRVMARANLQTISSLVGVCPLLGLLGTVVGMLEVFDVLSLAGNENPRAMAAGISKAIISTMAGLVGAISGLLPREQLVRYADRAVQRFAERLERERDLSANAEPAEILR